MKKTFLTFTAILAIAITTNSFAQTGNPSGGRTTGTPTTDQKRDPNAGTTGTTGNPGTPGTVGGRTGASGKAGTTGTADGTGATNTKGSTADTKNMKALNASDLVCCADIFYRDATKGAMIPVADNPFGGKFAGRKLTFQLKDGAGKIVPAAKYKFMKDNDGNIVIVGTGLTGKGYALVVTVTGSKESETYHIDLM